MRTTAHSIRSAPLEQLPDDLIFTILLWLPAKSLMRLKAVCKKWYALIRDPSFAESHHIHSRTRPGASYLLFHISTKCLDPGSIHPANPVGVFSNQLPVHTFDEHGGDPCSNIVNGLICLWRFRQRRLELLNLTTGEKVALPDLRGTTKSKLPSCQLGFDPISNQYKVLFCIDRTLFILTLSGSNMWWRKVEDRPLAPIRSYRQGREGRSQICVDGAIYCFDYRSKLLVDGKRVVQYFDVTEEKFKWLPIHDQVGNERFEFEMITTIEGKFTFAGLVERLDRSESVGEMKLRSLINSFRDDELVWVKSEIQVPSKFLGITFSIVGSTKTGKVLISTAHFVKGLVLCELGQRVRYETAPLLRSAQMPRRITGHQVSFHVENILPLHPLIQQQGN